MHDTSFSLLADHKRHTIVYQKTVFATSEIALEIDPEPSVIYQTLPGLEKFFNPDLCRATGMRPENREAKRRGSRAFLDGHRS